MQRNRAILERERIPAFVEVASVPDLASGIVTVAQAHGFAGLSSNSVMLGWPKQPTLEHVTRQVSLIRELAACHKSTLVFRPGDRPPRPEGPVVLWWKGKESNGDLMLLLAHLLALDPSWRGTEIILKSIVDDPDAAAARQQELDRMLPEVRIHARMELIVKPQNETVNQVIRRQSVGARLVFLGLRSVSEQDEKAYADALGRSVEGLTDVLLVRNAGPFRGTLVG